MHRRIWVALGVTSALVGAALSAGGAYAYFWDQSRSDLIATGVTIAGIDVGGLRAGDAQAKLEDLLARRLKEPVQIVYDDRRFTVHPTTAGLHVDVARMVDAALAATRDGGLAHRVVRDLQGRRVAASIPLRAAVSRQHVASFVQHVARVIDEPARDARVEPRPLATGIRIVPSKPGLAVKRPQLEQRITNALLRLDGEAQVSVPTRAVAPRWWTSTLKRRYGTYLLVSRETYTLRLYKNLRLVKTYGIAVGRAGLETPSGTYEINDKQVNPWWHVPNSPWAGALAGRVIPPGPDDPIKSRWMGFYNGAGIHGTTEDWSIGTAASHGCIRMHIWDVEDLYDRVPLHTPIYVG
jgi:lipoprotein-anchoring transpeptidase ErfK/SrfK